MTGQLPTRPATTDQPDAASELAQELRAVLGKLKRRLRAQGYAGEDLTPTQVAVLLRLERGGPATAASLARAEAMRPQSMASVVSALEDAGLVEGRSDPDDGRRTLLSLTDACFARLQDGRAARQDWLMHAIQSRLSPKEQGALAGTIGLLRRLADD